MLKSAALVGDFTLSSGKKSDFFINCKPVALSAEGRFWIHQAYREFVRKQIAKHGRIDWTAVAAIPIGGCPIAHAIAGSTYDVLYARKETKDHGTRTLVEGTFIRGETNALLVEDVITTGQSVIEAYHNLKAAGVTVVSILALVDREEDNGLQRVKDCTGVPVTCLFTKSELIKL